MALRPIHGRAVWARCPRSVTSMRSVPWHPASSSPPVGSPRMATSPASRSGRSRSEVGEAVVLGGHLLPRVEHVGHVDGRARARPRRGRASPPARPSCRRCRGPTARRRRSGARRCRSPARCRCGRRGSPGVRAAELRAGDEVGADPLHVEVRQRRAARASRWSVSGRLVVAHRRDRHQRRRARRAGRDRPWRPR